MDENVYLDNAATSWPKPEPVYALMDRFSRDIGVNPGRGGHALAADADRLVRQTRRLLAAVFNHRGSIDRVIFTGNGTEALNLALQGSLSRGDRVITSGLEHNAVARVLAHLGRQLDLQVTHVGADSDGYLDPAAVDAALGRGADLLVINHASNVIGTVQPLAAIAASAQRHGVRLVVDAAQTAGVVPIDVTADGIGLLAFPGHKGLFGPMGSGALIVADGIELPPQRFGGTGVDSASVYQPDALPFRLEAGTLAAPAIAGLFAAQLWLGALGRALQQGVPAPGAVLDVPLQMEAALERAEATDATAHARDVRRAMAHIHRVELAHVQAIETLLQRFPRARILGGARADARVATLGFTVDGVPASEIAERLDADHGICSRAGLQCAPWAHEALGTVAAGGSVRLSPGYFTTASDLSRLADGLDDVLADR